MLCWKCFYIIQAYHNEKVCPYCKTSCQTIQYVEPSLLEEKKITDIKFIKDHKKIKVRSKDKKGETEMMNIHSHYDSQEVKDFIYRSTAPYCYECDKEFRSYTEYKKHVEVVHNNYLCELCLKNRHCVISDLQIYSTKKELMDHLNGRGEDSNVNHQKCQYWGTYHDNKEALQRHFLDEHRVCEFCQKTKKKYKDYVFANYRMFMDHAKQFHLICGTGGCDAVFKDVTSLDLHQSEYHKKKVSLRIAHKDSDDEDEKEEEKKPQVSSAQYKRMNNQNRNEHFPTLNNQKVYKADSKETPKGNKEMNTESG